MAVNRNQVKELLGTGLGPDIVATAVGCLPAYITELMQDEEFKQEVTTLRILNLTAASSRDKGIDNIEEKLIGKLHEAVDAGQIYKPQDILRAFAVVNAAKRRGVAAQTSTVINNTVVNLQLPSAAVKRFTINPQGEVLGVEEQTLVTMPTHTLLSNLSRDSKTKGGEDRYARVSRYLPETTISESRRLSNSGEDEGER